MSREYGAPPIGLTMAAPGAGLVVCPDCGAMVLHVDRHNAFHDEHDRMKDQR